MSAAARGSVSVAAALLTAGIAALAMQGDLAKQAGQAMLLGLLCCIPFAFLAWRAFRGEVDVLWPLVVLGVALRIVMLCLDAGFSDDAWRLAWEGRVVRAGMNPYALAPDSPALESLRDGEIWPHVAHRDVPAAYPPLTLAVCAVAGALPHPLLVLRIAFTLIDLGAWLALCRWLKALGLPTARSIVWGLSPLVLIEIAGGGHSDSLAVLLTVLAGLSFARGSPSRGAIALALAVLAKPYALVLAPLLLPRRAPPWLLFAGVAALGSLPMLCASRSGLGHYAATWSFNGALFPALRDSLGALADRAATASLHLPPAINRWIAELDCERAARVLLAALLIAIVVRLARRDVPPAAKARDAVFALLLCSPTVHPWYLLWLLPLLATAESPPLLLWSCSVLASYAAVASRTATGVWTEDAALRAAQYAPVLLWMAWRAASGSAAATAGAGTAAASEGAGGGAVRSGSSEPRPAQ